MLMVQAVRDKPHSPDQPMGSAVPGSQPIASDQAVKPVQVNPSFNEPLKNVIGAQTKASLGGVDAKLVGNVVSGTSYSLSVSGSNFSISTTSGTGGVSTRIG